MLQNLHDGAEACDKLRRRRAVFEESYSRSSATRLGDIADLCTELDDENWGVGRRSGSKM